MVGILSGPNAFDALVCFRTLWSSEIVNSDVEMSKVSAIFSLGSEILSGSFGSLPRRLPKCWAQLASRLDWEPPLRRIDGLERFPEISEMVFQAAWCCLEMWREARSEILPLMKSVSA